MEDKQLSDIKKEIQDMNMQMKKRLSGIEEILASIDDKLERAIRPR
jgi:hypothetical protein